MFTLLDVLSCEYNDAQAVPRLNLFILILGKEIEIR